MATSERRNADEAYRDLRRLVEADMNVVGFFLGGSQGKHFATMHSDYDCYVIVRDEVQEGYVERLARFGPPLDVIVRSLTQFRDEPGPAWNRYNFAHLTVELDRLDGEIQRIVEQRATLTADEAAASARWALPAYTNAVYRSLKSLRDARELEARLDAAESINYFLTALFSIAGRLRPYNKFLRWELTHYPLPEWRTEDLLDLIERVSASADPVAQRTLFGLLEREARARGFGSAFAEWQPEQLDFIRAGGGPTTRNSDPNGVGSDVTADQLLGGGRSTTVSRVGDTVRRATGPWTPTVHAYLRHLRGAGFVGAPEVLGLDEQGREILRFIEGTTLGEALDPHEPKTEFVTVRPWPAAIRSDRALVGIGRLLRAMHDAARAFLPVAPVWREYDSPMGPDEIVTHGDIGPWNVVYRGEDPVAFIDFDNARPQRPMLELAWAAWHCVPLGDDPHLLASGFTAPFPRGERLRTLADAYGLTDRSALLDALSEVKQRWPARLRYWQPLRPNVAAQHLRFCADELDWLERNREDLASHLE